MPCAFCVGTGWSRLAATDAACTLTLGRWRRLVLVADATLTQGRAGSVQKQAAGVHVEVPNSVASISNLPPVPLVRRTRNAGFTPGTPGKPTASTSTGSTGGKTAVMITTLGLVRAPSTTPGRRAMWT